MQLAQFEYWLTARGLSSTTISDAVTRIQYLSRSRALSKSGFEQFVVTKRKTCTNNTINVYLKALKLYGKYTRDEAIETLKLLPKNSGPRSTLSADELSRFLNVTVPHSNASKCNYGLFFKLLAYCGMRPHELAILTRENVSFAEACLYLVDTKTHDTRKVPIPESLLEELTHIHHDPLFPTNTSAWGRAFHYRLELAGIERRTLTPYSLRRTAITLLLQQPNSNLFDVQNLVGHRDANTTARYYSICLDRIKRLVNSHPLLNHDLPTLERARFLCDLIRSVSIHYNPTLITHKNHTVEIRLLVRPPPKNGNPHATS